MQKSAARQWPIYPWLITLYPVLYLYSLNTALVRFAEVWPVLIISLAAVTAVFLALYATLKNSAAAAAIAATLSFLFFSYGQIYNLVAFKGFFKQLETTQQHLVLALIAGLAAALIIALVVKKKDDLQGLTHTLNLMTVVLVAVPVGMLGLYLSWYLKREPPSLAMDIEHPTESPDPESLPDIYFIILDCYSRNDLLIEIADFDNSEFLAAMQARGFYIAHEARSNYSTTPDSLASSLNMQYLDSFSNIREGRLGLRHIIPGIKDHAAGRALKERGYTFVYISSGWPPTDTSPIADINIEFTTDGVVYYGSEDNPASNPSTRKRVFLPLLLGTTFLRPFLPPLTPTQGVLEWYDPDRTLQTFEVLTEIPEMEEPTFTFLHMVKPHTPYMFDRYGNAIEKPPGWTVLDERSYVIWPDAFVDQLIFVNNKVLETVDQILAKSDVPPIIIIQADHGHYSTRILSAYYLPGGGDALLYPSITPVNNFRLILDYYFGTHLGLLEDRSYIVPNGHNDPYNFVEVKNDQAD